MDLLELRDQLERHHDESYGWALSCCLHNRLAAEEVVQMVYLKVLEGKARYDGKAAFKTWLFSVIRNTAADARRRNTLDRLRLIRYGRETEHAIQEDQLDQAIHQLQWQMVFQRTLADLPTRQREVLQLVFYHELSLEEAAHVMRISVGSARTHYERGKKRLREWLEGVETGDESRLGGKRNRQPIPGPASEG